MNGEHYNVFPGLPVMVHVESAGAGGAEVATLAVPAGEMWLIVGATGWHDDNAAGRDVSFTMDWGGTDVAVTYDAAVAQLTYVALFTRWPVSYPLIIPPGGELRYEGVGLGAGKKTYLRAAVMKLRGIEPWSHS